MDFVLLGTAVILLIGARPFFIKYNDDYISRDQTQCINGFFVLIVFMRHFQQYVTLEQYDLIYQGFSSWMSQLIVVPFLFYSGYGIMTSISKKGDSYVTDIMKKRFPRVLLHFAFAVLIFFVTDMILGYEYPPERVLLSFIGWEGIGNSNWYIFDTLVLYILTFVSFRLCKKDKDAALVTMFVLTAGFVSFMLCFKATYWYNTCILFPIGMVFARIGKGFENSMKKHRLVYLVSMPGSVIAVIYLSEFRFVLISFELFAAVFMLSVVLLTMKLRIGNPILRFLGKYVFEIYILQRLPMIILRDAGLDKYLYMLICFASTLLIAVLFKLITNGCETLLGKIGKRITAKSKASEKAADDA